MKIVPVLVALVSVTSLEGCSARQAYNNGREAQKNDCLNRVIDQDEFRRCMERTSLSYEAYLKSEEERKTRRE